MRITLKIFIFLSLVAASLAAFFVTSAPESTVEARDELVWGVDFSESQAEYLGLDAEETYSAIINDLGAKHIKIHINWNATEPEKDVFNFESLDRQVALAEEAEVKLILVIGLKTGRWPECHTPDWYEAVPESERHAELITYISTLVERYKSSPAVQYWQVENEPLLKFGVCPQGYYKSGIDTLRTEVDAVRAIDPSRKIIVSDSGELSTWTDVAGIADIVGITTYRSTWNGAEKTFGLNPYTFLSPDFYASKAAFIQKLYGKQVISIELQAEPWASKPLAEASLEEQAKSMNPELFDENVEFAKQTGLQAFYFWGVEWWYWMKTKHDQPLIWNKARILFIESD